MPYPNCLLVGLSCNLISSFVFGEKLICGPEMGSGWGGVIPE